MGLINLVVESKLYRNQIRLTFQCVGSKIVMQYIDDSEVEIFVNIVTSMSHNKVQLFLGNHVVESDVSRFVRENYLVAMGCLGAGSKQICKL